MDDSIRQDIHRIRTVDNCIFSVNNYAWELSYINVDCCKNFSCENIGISFAFLQRNQEVSTNPQNMTSKIVGIGISKYPISIVLNDFKMSDWR